MGRSGTLVAHRPKLDQIGGLNQAVADFQNAFSVLPNMRRLRRRTYQHDQGIEGGGIPRRGGAVGDAGRKGTRFPTSRPVSRRTAPLSPDHS